MDQHNLSDVKQFAVEVLDVFDELARPEIKRSIFKKMWEYLKSYSYKIILKKPDAEINEKLLIIHQKLNSRFKDLDMSIEMNAAEKMGSVKIPNVGQLAKTKKLTSISDEQAKQILQELNF